MIKKKICMVGLYGVGKTSLVRRFVQSLFDDKYLTTIGVKVDRKDIDVGGRVVSLAIWDMAGEDEVAQVRTSHLRGASGYILVADGCRRASLDKAVDLRRRIEAALGDLPFLLVMNKADLRAEWEVADADMAALQDEGWPTLETSAKNGNGVDEAFTALAQEMLNRDADSDAAEDGE